LGTLYSTTTFGQQKLSDSIHTIIKKKEKEKDFNTTNIDYLKLLAPLAESYLYQNKDSLHKYTSELKRLSKKAGYEKGVILSELINAKYEAYNGDHKKGAETAAILQKSTEEVGCDTLKLKALNIQGVGWSSIGDYPKGYIAFKQGEAIGEKLNSKSKLFTIRLNLATCFSLLKDYDTALDYYMKNYNLLDGNIHSARQKAQLEANIGFLHWKNNNYIKGKSYSQKAIAVFSANKNAAWESFCRISLGGIAIKEKNISEALKQYSLARELLKNMNDKKRETDAFLGFAEAYLLNTDIQNAEKFTLDAITIAMEIDYKDGLSLSYHLLYRINQAKGDYKKAIKYLELSQDISNSLRIEENKTQFLMLAAKTDYEREQEKIKIEIDDKLAKQKVFNRIIIFALLISLFIGFLIRKNYITQKKTNQRLKEINNTKDKIFSIIGHDLKTPLNTLNELLELVKEKNISPKEMIELTPKIQTNVDYSTFSLNNLLCWAQSEMDGITTNPIKFDVNQIINEAISVFEIKAAKKNIAIVNTIEEEIIIKFDDEHLRIIFRNILCNAIKFTPNNGNIRISSKIENNQIKLSVSDTGIGYKSISYDHLIIGKPVESIKGTNNEKGTGLGLSICKELLSKNNSTLRIEPNTPSGSCFTILIPVRL
jgi:signal transduction histidine kinase